MKENATVKRIVLTGLLIACGHFILAASATWYLMGFFDSGDTFILRGAAEIYAILWQPSGTLWASCCIPMTFNLGLLLFPLDSIIWGTVLSLSINSPRLKRVLESRIRKSR